MVKLQRRPLGEPDHVRQVPFGELETYDLGDVRFGRSVLQPGWRWSESIRPIARTEWCEDRHIGYSVSGGCRIRMREGAELVIGAGQFYEIPPGHDSWVDGDEPWVSITWQPSTAFRSCLSKPPARMARCGVASPRGRRPAQIRRTRESASTSVSWNG